MRPKAVMPMVEGDICRSEAYVWQSGRDAQFSSVYRASASDLSLAPQVLGH